MGKVILCLLLWGGYTALYLWAGFPWWVAVSVVPVSTLIGIPIALGIVWLINH